MPQDRQAAQTQVSWALLSEATASARLEAHRLRHLIERGQRIVDSSAAKDHIYQVAGDLMLAVPRRLDALDTDLDRLSYALSVLGADHLRDRLPMADRALVDDATHRPKPPGTRPSASRVAARYLARRRA